MSVYLPTIPQANDVISVSQGQLLTNFQQIDDGMGLGISNDHVSLTNATAANRGHHAQVRFVEVADPTTAVSQLALYAKDVAGSPRLFIREQSSGTIYQLNAGTPSNATIGHSWLPGGLLIKWGSFTTAVSILQTLTYATGATIPAFSAAPYSFQAMVESPAGSERVFINVRQGTNTATGIQINTVDQGGGNIGARTLYWVAIGPS